MKTLKLYNITEKEFEETAYRQNREITEIDAHDDWTYGDAIGYWGECDIECVVDCADLYVWKISGFSFADDFDDIEYVVEMK